MENYTSFIENFWDYSLRGYMTSMGHFFYPIVFGAIIAYIYMKTQSAIAASVGILLMVVAYSSTNIFTQVGVFMVFLQIIITLATIGLIILFISRWRK